MIYLSLSIFFGDNIYYDIIQHIYHHRVYIPEKILRSINL